MPVQRRANGQLGYLSLPLPNINGGVVPAKGASTPPLHLPPRSQLTIDTSNSTTTSRAGPMSSTGFQPGIYIPAILIVSGVILAIIFAVLRQRLRASHLSLVYSSTTRQLTADQLAANPTTTTTPTTANNAAAAASPNATARRTRRRRRRASQISVTSLPLYMEEAGDQELVLVRGERDEPIPEDAHDLESGLHTGTSTTTTTDEDPSPIRASYEFVPDGDLESGSSTPQIVVPIPSPPPPAVIVPILPSDSTPSYEEALNYPLPQQQSEIDLSDDPPAHARDSTITPNHARDATITPNHARDTTITPFSTTTTTRRTMPTLRNLFHRASQIHPSPPLPQQARQPTTSLTHLLSHQRSNSTFSTTSLARTLSHTSNPNPNASMISLNSISAPLAHTLTRTEISYPKGGPTAEQMRFLGSRESLALFGVPWGEAAVRYASAELPAFEAPPTTTTPPEVVVPDTGHSPEPSAATGVTSFITAEEGFVTADEGESEVSGGEEDVERTPQLDATPRFVIRAASPVPPPPEEAVVQRLPSDESDTKEPSPPPSSS